MPSDTDRPPSKGKSSVQDESTIQVLISQADLVENRQGTSPLQSQEPIYSFIAAASSPMFLPDG